jgi:hypothetical protein
MREGAEPAMNRKSEDLLDHVHGELDGKGFRQGAFVAPCRDPFFIGEMSVSNQEQINECHLSQTHRGL